MNKEIEIERPDIKVIPGIGKDGRIFEINSDNKELVVERAVLIANFYYQIAENESKILTEMDYEKNAAVCSIYCLAIEIYIKAFIFNSYKKDEKFKNLGHCLIDNFDKIGDDYKWCFEKKYFERYHEKIVEKLENINNDFIEKRYIYEQFEISDDLELTKRLASFFKEMSYNELIC